MSVTTKEVKNLLQKMVDSGMYELQSYYPGDCDEPASFTLTSTILPYAEGYEWKVRIVQDTYMGAKDHHWRMSLNGYLVEKAHDLEIMTFILGQYSRYITSPCAEQVLAEQKQDLPDEEYY